MSYDRLRHRLREALPMQRKQHTKAMARISAEMAELSARLTAVQSELVDAKASLNAVADRSFGAAPASSAKIAALVPIETGAAQEVCLFVTHAPMPSIKSFVVEHVKQLAANDIAVVLIVNTSHSADQFRIDTEFRDLLKGCLIRENTGFDFGAWAQAFALLPSAYQRLFLINDSIVGPLRGNDYAQLLAKIRASSADMTGLTENSKPQPHLQSYFLALNERLLRSPVFDRLMKGVVNLPSKEGVIVQYETQLTRFLAANGFRCEALFPRLTRSPENPLLSNDTIHHWAELIGLGFPFVKGEVLRTLAPTAEHAQLIPERFFSAVERAR